MLSWGATRRLAIIAVIGAVGLMLVAWYSVRTFYRPPSCSDGRQNQGETGIDCGGPCARLCPDQGQDLVVHWKRMFPVSAGKYNVVAYVENPNPMAGAASVSYEFKLFDSFNILVAERAGATPMPPHQVTPVFEADLFTGSRTPVRVEFLYTTPMWTVLASDAPDVRVVEQKPVIDSQTVPLVTARILNSSKKALSRLHVVAIVYDEVGNAQEASETVVDSIAPWGLAPVSFSWPSPFNFVLGRVEILPKAFPGINY